MNRTLRRSGMVCTGLSAWLKFAPFPAVYAASWMQGNQKDGSSAAGPEDIALHSRKSEIEDRLFLHLPEVASARMG